MADKKISALTAATTPLAGTEVLPIVQGGSTVKVAVSDLTAGRAISATQLTLTTENLVIATAGKGIDFSANTHAAGMTSELLNWYETGTWTGGISFGGGSTGITYANNVGYYTRIGNIVTVSCYLVLSNKGSSTGAARITGLPFTCVNNASGYSALSVLPLNVTFTGQLSGYANINDTTIDLVPSTGVALTDVGFANNSTFIISLTYRAA
jgi:hypothetical protein